MHLVVQDEADARISGLVSGSGFRSGLRSGLVNRLGSGSRSGLVNHGCGFVDDGSGLVDDGSGWCGLVSGSGSGLVSGGGVVFGLSFVGDIGDETRVTIDLVHNTLDTTVGKLDSVFAVGLVAVAVFFVVEVLVVVAFLVVHVIAEVVEGSHVGVGGCGVAGLVGQSDRGKG